MLKFYSIMLLIGLMLAGFTLAAHKPIWNDEIYTQAQSVQGITYGEMIFGQIGEGNNSPLFYALQKMTCQALGYSMPYRQDEYYMNGDKAKIILRINPVFYIALTMTLIFYFFARYSLWTGLFSLFLCLTTTSLWFFWAEARPYSLWILLTTVQALLFLRISKGKDLFGWLVVVHVLLSFTVVFSLAQIVIVAFLLSFRNKKYLLTALPCLVCIFYYIHAPKMPFYVPNSIIYYIREAISRDRMYIILAFIFYLAAQRKSSTFLLFTLGMMLSVCAVLLVFRLNENPDKSGFSVTSRYFVHLAPVGIIAVTLFTDEMMRACKNNWMRILLVCSTGYLVTHRIVRIIFEIGG